MTLLHKHKNRWQQNLQVIGVACIMHFHCKEDFATEKRMLQHYIENQGHICMFLPKFHCELNPIEMLWGYAKYCESLTSFLFLLPFTHNPQRILEYLWWQIATTKQLVLKCLDLCDTIPFLMVATVTHHAGLVVLPICNLVTHHTGLVANCHALLWWLLYNI